MIDMIDTPNEAPSHSITFSLPAFGTMERNLMQVNMIMYRRIAALVQERHHIDDGECGKANSALVNEVCAEVVRTFQPDQDPSLSSSPDEKSTLLSQGLVYTIFRRRDDLRRELLRILPRPLETEVSVPTVEQAWNNLWSQDREELVRSVVPSAV